MWTVLQPKVYASVLCIASSGLYPTLLYSVLQFPSRYRHSGQSGLIPPFNCVIYFWKVRLATE
jgi:hypothetical protein